MTDTENRVKELEAALRSTTDLLKRRVEDSYDIEDDPEVIAAVQRTNSLLGPPENRGDTIELPGGLVLRKRP